MSRVLTRAPSAPKMKLATASGRLLDDAVHDYMVQSHEAYQSYKKLESSIDNALS